MKVKIQGTIVSADYDCEFFDGYINKGIITPSSRIVSQIETASEPVELYVNSYGGDVFAGGEMMIALQKCKRANMLASVEVGSIAASMAANIVADLSASGVRVVGHANSQVMFHGCYTTTEGGAQHHEDVAESLRNINDAVIANLNRLGITECRAWFAEGREKWIGAEEAVQLKLFDSIDGADAPAISDAKRTASRLAAFASKLNGRKEYAMDLDTTVTETKPTEEAKTEPVAPVAEELAGSKAEDISLEEPAAIAVTIPLAECEKRLAGLQAAKDRKISEITNEFTARIEKAEKELADLQAALKEKDDALAKMQAAYEAEKVARESVVTSALAPAPAATDFGTAINNAKTPEERIKLAVAEAKKRIK